MADRTSQKPVAATKQNQSALSQRGLLIAWEAPEFRKFTKDIKWLMSIIGVVVVLGIFFGWQRNWSALAVTCAGAVVFYVYGQRDPKVIRYSIDADGFRRGEQLISWNDLKSFWINEGTEGATLYLETTARFINFEKIDLENVGLADLRRALSTRLPQSKTQSEEFFDRISRIIRF